MVCFPGYLIWPKIPDLAPPERNSGWWTGPGEYNLVRAVEFVQNEGEERPPVEDIHRGLRRL